MPPDVNVYLLPTWGVCAVIGALIGAAKGRPAAGFFWGLLLGPLGVLVIAVAPDTQPKCPDCGGTVVEGAKKCKNCGSTLPVAGAQGVPAQFPAPEPYRGVQPKCPICGANVRPRAMKCESCQSSLA